MKEGKLVVGEKSWRAYIARYPWEWIIGTYGKDMDGRAMVFLFPWEMKVSFHNSWGKFPLYVGFFDKNRVIFALEKLFVGKKTIPYICKGAIEWSSHPGEVLGKKLLILSHNSKP